VESIGGSAFYNCTSLTSITVDADNSNYSSVDGVLFNKLQTSLVQHPAGILDDSYTIPDSVTSIGSRAFYYCTSLTSVTLPATLFIGGIEGNYSSYGLSSEQVRLAKTSINAFVANAETAARTTGRSDVTSDPATYSLYTANEVTASRTAGQSDVTSDPSSYSLYTASDVSTAEATARTTGRSDVTSSPASYDLYTAGDVSTAEAASRTLGQTDVTASPSIYDLHTSTELAEATAAARTIVNVSARVNIGAGETVIPGFVVLGESKQLLIRAVGPKLADLGVPSPLPDPTMTIYRTRYDGQPNDVVAIINDWKADGADVAAINAAMATAGAFPLEPVADFQGNPLPTDDTKSAATLITLSVGVYTVVVTSADGGQGDVLVEAYEIY
jgi:hypothetical protein